MAPVQISKFLSRTAQLYRVRDWKSAVGLAVLGWLTTGGRPAHLVTATATSALLLAFSFAFNDICDARYTNESTRLGELYRDQPEAATGVAILPLVAAVLLLWTLPPRVAVAAAGFVLLTIQYSAPPFQLTARPVLGTITNVISALLLILVGASSRPLTPATVILILVYTWFFILAELLHQVDDFDEDQAAGRSTLAIIIGPEQLHKILKIGCLAVSIVAAMTALFLPEIAVLLVVASLFNLLRVVRLNGLSPLELGDCRERLFGTVEGLVYLIVLSIPLAGQSTQQVIPVLVGGGVG
ncbi:MAG: UbiA family prenyltransferase [Candidatus Nanohaloarchaea archaeon]|nr:UbiA family prenyltransferase [Candidatus Nanohaloarchaea archaeon]